MINRVILVGRLTKNPEIRKTPNGASICKFTLAVSRKVKAQGQPDADFIDGRLQTGKFTNNNGGTIYTCDVMVESLQFLDKKEETQNNDVNQEREMSYSEGGYPQW